MTNPCAVILASLIVSASPAIGAFSPAAIVTAQLAPNDAMRRPTVCTEQYAPVCGRLGNLVRTYSNACFARAAGADVIAQGPCTDTVAPPRAQ
jgi:hypothetical protein